jgi:hypothetical protein
MSWVVCLDCLHSKRLEFNIKMRMIRAGLLLALLLAAPLGRADWINLTGSETAPNIAEIYVMDDHVRLVFEVYIGDLEKFTELVPDAKVYRTGAGCVVVRGGRGSSIVGRAHAHFLQRALQVRDRNR